MRQSGTSGRSPFPRGDPPQLRSWGGPPRGKEDRADLLFHGVTHPSSGAGGGPPRGKEDRADLLFHEVTHPSSGAGVGHPVERRIATQRSAVFQQSRGLGYRGSANPRHCRRPPPLPPTPATAADPPGEQGAPRAALGRDSIRGIPDSDSFYRGEPRGPLGVA